MAQKILIIDDDAKLRSLLSEYLSGYGFSISCLSNGGQLMEILAQAKPDLVVLDVMLPQENGLDLLKKIRGASLVPVIMLTAKGEEADRIVGLELGADDYMAKPFNPRELLARIKAVLRRPRGPVSSPVNQTVLRAGGMELDTDLRILKAQGVDVELSQTESKLLAVLMKNPNKVFSRDELLNIARGRQMMAFDRSIDVHISNLRNKLTPFPGLKNVIKTVWGAGYLFQEIP